MPSFLNGYINDPKFADELKAYQDEKLRKQNLIEAIKFEESRLTANKLNFKTEQFKADLQIKLQILTIRDQHQALLESTKNLLAQASKPFKDFLARHHILQKLNELTQSNDPSLDLQSTLKSYQDQYKKLTTLIFEDVINNYLGEQIAEKENKNEVDRLTKMHHLNILGDYMVQASHSYQPSEQFVSDEKTESFIPKSPISSQVRIGGGKRFFFQDDSLDVDEEVTAQQLDELDQLL